MDEMLNKDQLRIEIRSQIVQNFPKDIIDKNKLLIEQQVEQAVNFIILFSENKYFAYIKAKKDDTSIEEHFSKIPEGIDKLEEWFSVGLLDFAKEILLNLDTEMTGNIDFARLFDNRDYEAFIKNSKTKDIDIEQWKLLLEPIFQMSETPYISNV